MGLRNKNDALSHSQAPKLAILSASRPANETGFINRDALLIHQSAKSALKVFAQIQSGDVFPQTDHILPANLLRSASDASSNSADSFDFVPSLFVGIRLAAIRRL
jgi:hypothetical protein